MAKSQVETAKRARYDIKDARMQAEIFREHSITAYIKPRKNTIMQALCDEIYEVFSDAHEANSKLRSMPAAEFAYIKEKHSPNTIIKARRILGIRSKKRNGKNWWSYPKYPPSEALAAAHYDKIEKLNKYSLLLKKHERPAAVAFRGHMEAFNLMAVNKDVYKVMKLDGYSVSTTRRMKSDLGVAKYTKEGVTYWVWGRRDVMDWIEIKLEDGPRLISDLEKEAMEEHGWAPEVIGQARKGMDFVRPTYISPRLGAGWVDISHMKADEPDPPRAIPLSPRVVRVDFTGTYKIETI